MAKYTLLKQEGTARRGQFETVHGTVQTPAFMNVATSAAIKGEHEGGMYCKALPDSRYFLNHLLKVRLLLPLK